MARRFVIGTNRTTPEQDTAFLGLLNARWPHLGWWHQLSETWLVVDLTDAMTAEVLRDAAKQAFGGIYLLVIELDGTNWAGFGKTTSPGGMFEWMRTQWRR